MLDRCGSTVAVYYMAIPPSMFPIVAESLASVGLNERGRIVVEKPFGRDLQSAIELNKTLHDIFPEERIFRIDHYLGKEAVEDLLVFRFSNMLLEPIWNRNYVRSVQVTMAESIGVEGRGSFYEGVGAIRDVFQNHLLQVVSLLAMEPPADPDSSFLQDEKAKVLAAMEPIDPSCMVRGQYIGYREEPGVDPHSDVETYVAARLQIDSWRWAGVPWYVRVGKALGHSVTEAVVELRDPPQLLFDEARRPAAGAQPDPLPAGQARRRDVRAAGEDAGPAPRQPGGRHLRGLRVRARRALRGLRAAAQRRHRRLAAALRPRGRRRADVAGRPAGARRARRRSTPTSARRGGRRKPTGSSAATAGSNRLSRLARSKLAHSACLAGPGGPAAPPPRSTRPTESARPKLAHSAVSLALAGRRLRRHARRD